MRDVMSGEVIYLKMENTLYVNLTIDLTVNLKILYEYLIIFKWIKIEMKWNIFVAVGMIDVIVVVSDEHVRKDIVAHMVNLDVIHGHLGKN